MTAIQYRPRPFFLYLAYNAVHSPLRARKNTSTGESKSNYGERSVYAATIMGMDDGVGRAMGARTKRSA